MNRRIACLALAVVGGSTSALLFAGCGDDTTTQSSDSGADVSTPDSTTSPGADSATADVANDQTIVETGADAGSDSSAAGDADAASDGDAAGDALACTPFDASGLDEASVQAGMLELWTVYKCQTCHQKASQTVDDAGVGLVLSGNNNGLGDSGLIFPPNLTNDPATGLGCWTDLEVVNAILQGKNMDGTNLCPSMPKWGNALLTDAGVRAGTPMDAGTAQQIVDFLRSLPVVSNKVMETMCPMPAQDGGGDAGDAAVDGGTASDGGSTDAAHGGDGATE
jgi:hypothetical protein